VPLWSHDTCNGALQAQFGPAYVLPDTAVCAGAEGRDACDVSYGRGGKLPALQHLCEIEKSKKETIKHFPFVKKKRAKERLAFVQFFSVKVDP